MVAQAGKAAFLKERGDAVAAFLKAGVAVCLVDVRGTGETQAGKSADRSGARTSVSQMNLMLGQTVLGAQVRDLRTVVRWLRTREGIDGKRLALWGDSFAPANAKDARIAVPHDAPDFPRIAEPGADLTVLLAALFEDGVAAVYTRGGLDADFRTAPPYLYVPHDAVLPGFDTPQLSARRFAEAYLKEPVKREARVDAQNRPTGDEPMSPADAAAWVVGKLGAKR